MGSRGRNTLKGLLRLLSGQLKKKKRKKNLWPRLHTDSSEIKHAEFTSEASGVQLWISVVIHVEKTITKQMPCAGLLLFPSVFPLLRCNWGERAISFFQKTMCSSELSVPIRKEQICSVHKTFVFEFPVYNFRETFSADIVSVLLYCYSQKLCRCFHTMLLLLGPQLCCEPELSCSLPNLAIFALSHPVPFLKLFVQQTTVCEEPLDLMSAAHLC